MPVSMLASVFTGASQTGTGRSFAVSNSSRYNAVSESSMIANGIHRNLSSATVYTSSTCDATVLLFQSLLPFLSMGNYNGLFAQLANRRSSGPELDVNSFPSGFDNHATSALLVAANRSPEIRLSFRDLFLDQWRDTIDDLLAGSEARRDGDPVLTWEMFPTGISYLDPSRMYLKIHQSLDVVLDWWPDYNASITYHLFLFLNASNRLQGQVARWAYWVEGGIKSGQIASRLEPQVISGMSTLNSQLASQLGGLTFTFTDLYYLPGRQVTPAARGVSTGNTFSDVTIVLQF